MAISLSNPSQAFSLGKSGVHHSTLKAAEPLAAVDKTKELIRQVVAAEAAGGFVRQILERDLGL